ncbi:MULTISPECIES: ABC transporter ATP-binding protein [Glutamicibacter]|uniref:ABC transporter n=1 Tax=Glutamicibacter arilaitensis TaxID=256701 RepID=A0A2N7RYL0_9MICC|nr:MULTISPECIES: ABC transporter ATP-binding protein [Glutamicibacter]PMQ18974.1 ABC transporter [Glutamicibacter arilaitensis]HCJ53215.1 ABC transporter ATP-binding protein [Glutamicibacter sp.]
MNNQYPAETLLCVEELRESYGDVAILDGNNFEVNRGEFVCIVGPSGSGKTTLLRSIAGLQPPTSGKTVFEGQEVTEPPAKLAVVFQDYSRSLLPWMSVADNVALPLKGKGSKQEIATRVDQALVSVGLAGRGKVYPWQMSGGMQQRAAIARGLAYSPDVLLMDEPFAAVDAQTHIELEDLVLRLRDEYNTTVLFVTHDIDEAVYLADRVLVLSGAPTKVTENIRTEMPNPRNQLETKRLDRFGEVREQVFTLIQNAKSHASI